MALDSAEVVVAGTGHLYLGAVGATLPTTIPTATPAGFVECGYFATDGATLKGSADISEFEAWQGTTAIRRSRRLQVQEITGDLLQWNENTVVAAFGGGVFTGTSPAKYTFPIAGDALAEYAVLLAVQDGLRNALVVVPRMNSGLEDVEVQFNKENMAVLPITLRSLATAVAPYILFDDATAFVPSS